MDLFYIKTKGYKSPRQQSDFYAREVKMGRLTYCTEKPKATALLLGTKGENASTHLISIKAKGYSLTLMHEK